MDLNDWKAHPLFTKEESARIDEFCHTELGYPETTLMGMAALSVYHANEDLWATAEEIWIVAGTGGNGGDGYALANILFQEGHSVSLFSLGDSKREDSLFYKSLCERSEIPIYSANDLPIQEEEAEEGSVLLVDAILGTGFKAPVSEPIANLIRWINSSPAFFYKLSLDTASGFSPNTETSVHIEADSIEELGTRKWENIGFLSEGKMVPRYYESIGFPTRTLKGEGFFSNRYYLEKLDWEDFSGLLKRKTDSHKYTAGSAIFFGGDEGMEGAVLLSSSAFQSLGGGISKIFTPSLTTKEIILHTDPSKMVSVSKGKEISEDPFFPKTKTIVVGPGTKEYPEFLKTFVLEEHQTLILDAGSIPRLGEPLPRSGKILLTPHAGEFERLTGKRCTTVQSAHPVALDFCKTNKVHLLFKSYVSLFVTPEGNSFVWESPNPKLATMGTGDLLVGIIARFLSLGYSIETSVYYALSFLEGTRETEEPFPSAFEILNYLVRKL
ncbi:NAD(P)H-hydrate epimerase [Leptospira idonii]|uniref:NAD(P)H-hydrate epimerase n=1 Tax=Leptospira idonii TaxID=1193500 RepID=UPI001FE5CA2D|nr:NAD(P)H-hydrate epimerase [Leptospira idonii]